MKDEEYRIVKFLKEGRSISEISHLLSLSYMEINKLLDRIKKEGYEYQYDFFLDATKRSTITTDDSLNHRIITSPEDDKIDLLFISDLHFGSIYENAKYLNLIYNYCTKENLHLILNLGDFVDGDVNYRNTIIPHMKQIEHALKYHPYSKDILNILLLGNHDYSLLLNYQIDVASEIAMARSDIVPIGYEEKEIDIKNDSIILRHPIPESDENKGTYCHKLILSGHGHQSKINMDTSNVVIYLPSLSDLNLNKSNFPGAVKLSLKMRCGLIEFIEVEELTIINNMIFTTNEINLFVGTNKSFKNHAPIKNEENVKVMRKVL